MKQNILFTSALTLVIIFSCGKEEISALDEIELKLISSKWSDPVVTVDGVDYSDVYKDFSIQFSKKTYVTTSGGPLWNASGTWQFVNEEANLMNMDGNREVEISFPSDGSLELSFLWEQNTFESGRSSSIKGKQRFRLKRK
jgi:hypothetical protein